MGTSRNTHPAQVAKAGARGFFAGMLVVTLLGSPANAQSGENIVKGMPEEPATAVWMLAAPHVGKKICEVQAETPLRFIAHARHGPHQFARVEVLEGDCAGKEGYVPRSILEPKP